jgi:hypothetical protein
MTIEKYIHSVKSLKDDYSEEIPSAILHSTTRLNSTIDESPKYKVRKAWFQCVGDVLADGIRKGYLPNEYIEKFHAFHNRNKETEFHSRDTKREDIVYANALLDDILIQLS